MKICDTKEEAEKDLIERRNKALNEIKEKGYKILDDRSFVGKYFPDDTKWVGYLLITTDEMIKDLMAFKPFDYGDSK